MNTLKTSFYKSWPKMSYPIKLLAKFKRNLKSLIKNYPSLAGELAALQQELVTRRQVPRLVKTAIKSG